MATAASDIFDLSSEFDWDIFDLSSEFKPPNGIQRNLTRSKILISSTKFVFFGPIGNTRWPPGLWLAEIFSTSLQLLNGIQRNLTGSTQYPLTSSSFSDKSLSAGVPFQKEVLRCTIVTLQASCCAFPFSWGRCCWSGIKYWRVVREVTD